MGCTVLVQPGLSTWLWALGSFISIFTFISTFTFIPSPTFLTFTFLPTFTVVSAGSQVASGQRLKVPCHLPATWLPTSSGPLRSRAWDYRQCQEVFTYRELISLSRTACLQRISRHRVIIK